MTPRYHGQKFFVLEQGKRFATPLFLVLIVVEGTDVVFAVDSIPAIFGVTQDPFLVFTSNIFAILGLRSLYFLLHDFMGRFHYLKYGLGLVLAFVGAKMVASAWFKVPIGISLGVIVALLGLSVGASWLFPPKPGARGRRSGEVVEEEEAERQPVDDEDRERPRAHPGEQRGDHRVAGEGGDRDPDQHDRPVEPGDLAAREVDRLLAPTSSPMGTESRKLKRAALARSRPSPSAAVIVTPEREVPGTRASACAQPISSPSRRPIAGRPRRRAPKRSAAPSSRP